MTSFAGRSVSALFLCAVALTAQQVDPDKPASSDPTPGQQIVDAAPPVDPTYTPLDLKQSYLYSFNEMFGPAQWIGFTAHAAIDMGNRSQAKWGFGTESFGVRVASHFGASFVRENIAFGVRALDHEDPRYFRMGHGNGVKRARHALYQTFMARRDDGTWMPAYSRFIADYTTPFIAQSWRPETFGTGRGIRGGSIAIGMGFGANLWSEFWPDLRKSVKFLGRFKDTSVTGAVPAVAVAPVP